MGRASKTTKKKPTRRRTPPKKADEKKADAVATPSNGAAPPNYAAVPLDLAVQVRQILGTLPADRINPTLVQWDQTVLHVHVPVAGQPQPD